MTPLERAIEALERAKKKADAHFLEEPDDPSWLWFHQGQAVALSRALRALRRIQKSTRGEP